jgi:hypothetical protein
MNSCEIGMREKEGELKLNNNLMNYNEQTD